MMGGQNMHKIPPVAAVSAKGPLGVVQLPRLWSKVLLDKRGLLPEGYSACGQGFDKVVLDGLGLDREEVLAYLTSEMPTYAQFETWVVERCGGSVAQEKIDKVNDYILGREFPEERAQTILENCGFPKETGIRHGAVLNQLDDWQEFHRYLTAD